MRITPQSNDQDLFVRVKTAVPKKSSPSSQLKPVCPRCGRDNRVTDVARFSHVGFYDSGFMADYYYDFTATSPYVGKRTGFCFFRPPDINVVYICDAKHLRN